MKSEEEGSEPRKRRLICVSRWGVQSRVIVSSLSPERMQFECPVPSQPYLAWNVLRWILRNGPMGHFFLFSFFTLTPSLFTLSLLLTLTLLFYAIPLYTLRTPPKDTTTTTIVHYP